MYECSLFIFIVSDALVKGGDIEISGKLVPDYQAIIIHVELVLKYVTHYYSVV